MLVAVNSVKLKLGEVRCCGMSAHRGARSATHEPNSRISRQIQIQSEFNPTSTSNILTVDQIHDYWRSVPPSQELYTSSGVEPHRIAVAETHLKIVGVLYRKARVLLICRRGTREQPKLHSVNTVVVPKTLRTHPNSFFRRSSVSS